MFACARVADCLSVLVNTKTNGTAQLSSQAIKSRSMRCAGRRDRSKQTRSEGFPFLEVVAYRLIEIAAFFFSHGGEAVARQVDETPAIVDYKEN